MKPQAPVNDAQMMERINKNSPVQMAVIKEKVEQRYTAGRAGGA
jgi:aromatase